ncbi:PIG-L family deacetylase, partial [bacterium]
MASLRFGKPLGKRGWAIAATVIVSGLGLLYTWNPQKIEFFPKDAPPSPRVTPETIGLFAPGRRVAVVVAHPDDPEFYISGTLLRLKASGAKLLIVLTTDGGKAYYPPFTTDVEANRRVRRQEQLDAAKAYGADVTFLDEPDGRMVPDSRVQGKVRDALREFDPEVVLTFDGDYPPTVQHR